MVLFSTNCPQCKVLEKKLEQANIPFEVTTDIQPLIDMGIKRAPILKTDDEQYLDFSSAVKYLRERENYGS